MATSDDLHSAASIGFQRQADVYAVSRPTYHPAIVDRCVREHVGGFVAELGAGTGILTAQLVAAGVVPIAIEPVASMREKLRERLPGLDIRDGNAESTHLDPSSVDTLIVGQAFHWFDYPATLDEIARVIRPGGSVVCLWNVRDETVPWVAQVTKVLERHAGDTPRHHTMQWRRAIEADNRFALVDDWVTPNPQPTTPSGVVDRTLSTSFIAALDDHIRESVLHEVRTIAEAVGQHFDYPYRSELQAWRFAP